MCVCAASTESNAVSASAGSKKQSTTELDFAHETLQVDVFRVDLVDDDHAAQALPCGRPHHAARDLFDAGLGVDHDRGSLDGRQDG